jgi:hypothetical protein
VIALQRRMKLTEIAVIVAMIVDSSLDIFTFKLLSVIVLVATSVYIKGIYNSSIYF